MKIGIKNKGINKCSWILLNNSIFSQLKTLLCDFFYLKLLNSEFSQRISKRQLHKDESASFIFISLYLLFVY